MSKALRIALAVWFVIGVAVGIGGGIGGSDIAGRLRAAPVLDGCVSLPDDIMRQIETGRAPSP